jgi:PKD repeat protein
LSINGLVKIGQLVWGYPLWVAPSSFFIKTLLRFTTTGSQIICKFGYKFSSLKKKLAFLLFMILTGNFLPAQYSYHNNIFSSLPRHHANPDASQNTNSHYSAGFLEDFDSYTSFTTNLSPWTNIDGDENTTWGIGNVSFPFQYSPMGFIVFSPSETTPPLNSPAIQPRSGKNFAACFASTNGANNDWLISPAMEAGKNSKVSFYVKSYSSQFGLERFRVGISTTTPDPQNFEIISGPNYLTAPADQWKLMEFNLSAFNGQTIYIAINCISENSFLFMLDDFNFSTTLPDTYSINGLVTDGVTGLPVEGALVSASGQSDTTDSNGNYFLSVTPSMLITSSIQAAPTWGYTPLKVSFSDISVDNPAQIECTKEGYEAYLSQNVPLPPSGFIEHNIQLTPEIASSTNNTTPSNNNLNSKSVNAIISRSWDFGDGNSSALQNPDHYYTTPGLYTVILTVRNSQNQYLTTYYPNLIQVQSLSTPDIPVTDENQLSIKQHHGNITVSSNEKITKLSIFDINGRRLNIAYPDSDIYSLRADNFSQGIYIIMALTRQGIKSGKIVIN